jgi:hypothetical protein
MTPCCICRSFSRTITIASSVVLRSHTAQRVHMDGHNFQTVAPYMTKHQCSWHCALAAYISAPPKLAERKWERASPYHRIVITFIFVAAVLICLHGECVLLHATEMQVLCGREVRFWELLRPCVVEEPAITCMQLRTDYLQSTSRTSLLVERVPPCSAAIRRTELFTKLLQALRDAFERADLLQSLPGELAGNHHHASDVTHTELMARNPHKPHADHVS